MMQMSYKIVIGGAALATCLFAGSLSAATLGVSETLPVRPVQEITLSGTVRASDTKAPVVGANVQVPGFSATLTDDAGAFELELPAEQAKVVVGAPGYQEQIVFVKTGQTSVEVWLYETDYNYLSQEVVLYNESQSRLDQAAAVQAVDLSRYRWKATSNDKDRKSTSKN